MPSGGANLGMWSEARKQEKLIRGALVDYRKRAERRSQYYEKIKQDPAQFLRVHGRKVRFLSVFQVVIELSGFEF